VVRSYVRMAEDAERNLLRRVNDVEDLFGSILIRDDLPDWRLGEELGNFLLRLWPEDPMAHFLLARSYRHLGDADRAAKELDRCRDLVERPGASSPEREVLLRILEAEARTQSS